MRSAAAVLLVGLLGCAAKPPAAQGFRCEAYCYFRNADGGLERQTLQGHGATIDSAWSALQSVCERTTHDKHQAELQISTSDHSCEFRTADRKQDCHPQ